MVPSIEMPPSQQQPRINLAELKAKIVKRLGPDKANRYFSHLNRLLSQRLSKVEFDKICRLAIGRENLSLHNLLIRSILRNAYNGKVPPPQSVHGVTPLLPGVTKTVQKEDGYRQSSEQNAPPHDQLYVNNKDLTEAVEYAEPVTSDCFQIRSTICAPLGIPFCADSLGGPRVSICHGLCDLPVSSNYLNSFDRGELPDTETLRKRMDHIAEAEGLNGLTIDCANLLNNGLDVYLKMLIKSCIELSRARSQRELRKTGMQKVCNYGKVSQGINCTWQNNILHCQTDIASMDETWEIKSRSLVSLEDFRVAMELNPHQLGDDWPLLLEKISFHVFGKE